MTTRIISCKSCGQKFIFRETENPLFAENKTFIPRYCPTCRREHREGIARKAESSAALNRKKEQDTAVAGFEKALTVHNTTELKNIKPDPNHTLIVIGNGFDLMHGVRSGYYHFRDSLGKRNALRETLEIYIDVEDIWADFENNLAKIDYNRMINAHVMDMWLDDFDVYSDDSAASYFAAIDASITPMHTICSDLPRRFRQWVDSLSPGTDDKPLSSLMIDCPVLCFNYTEFVETIYGVSPQNVCYIHGCRKKKEDLILGHIPTESLDLREKSRSPRAFGGKMPFIEMAQDQAAQMLSKYDDDLTKSCGQIIEKNRDFFNRLDHIENIIVIGHSLYPVDRDYYREIVKSHCDPSTIKWYFGCHSHSDLMRIEDFIREFRIEGHKAIVFRTDAIKVELHKPQPTPPTPSKIKVLCRTADGKWTVIREGRRFIIEDSDKHIALDQEFSQPVSYAFFNNSEQYLFAIIKGYPAGVFLYKIIVNEWLLLNELAPPENQSLINPRLKKIVLDDNRLIFVYNNRLRIFNTSSGELIESRAVKHAPMYDYSGEDITSNFKLYS